MNVFTQIKAVLIGFFLFALVLMPTCLVVLFLPLKRRLLIVSPVCKWVSERILTWICGAKTDISEDHRSDELKAILPAQGLYIANHQSFIDIPLVITKFQVPPIMKKEVLYIPFVGIVAWAWGCLIVSRTRNDSRRKVYTQTRHRILNQKIGIQIYPEGTRSKNSEPKTHREIKKTLMYFAYENKVPVTPVSMYGTRGVLSKIGIIKTGRHLGIIVHHELFPDDFPDRDSFANACWEKVVAGHNDLKARLHPLNN